MTEIWGPNSSWPEGHCLNSAKHRPWKLKTILEMPISSHDLLWSFIQHHLSTDHFSRHYYKADETNTTKKRTCLEEFCPKNRGCTLESIYLYLKQMNEVQRFKFNRISIILLTIKRRPLNTMEKYVKIFTLSPLTKISIRENSSRALSTAASTSFT